MVAASASSSPDPSSPLLSVEKLTVSFPVRRGLLQRIVCRVRAVDEVSLHLRAGETLGLVGESGCGKTTLGRAILRLVPATSGRITFDGRPVLELPRADMRRLRRRMQIVFQDPGGSLNPRLRVGTIVGEGLEVHGLAPRGRDRRERVDSLLHRCGLPRDSAARFPHEFSGGQRQRIAIARALALQPSLLICDEPTSALDVSIQAQILNLLRDLQREFNLACLFISHDMAVINHVCDRVAVMLGGRIIEEGSREDVIERPRHEYTQALLAAVPGLDPGREGAIR
jgi:ABC-type microcin C transport system duplicated ATPase subunit YejF